MNMDVQTTLLERGTRYGDFTDHARVTQDIKRAMYGAGAANWEKLSDVQKQALDVIADKIARILTGDPNYADNWHDIQGYARLAEERLPGSPGTTLSLGLPVAANDADRRTLALKLEPNFTFDITYGAPSYHEFNRRRDD